MSTEQRKWLARQLPELLKQQVLDAATVERLSAHYSLDNLSTSNFSKATILLAAIGGLLIGGGVIMLLAHNWDYFSRFSKVLIGLLPLIVAQILCLMALLPELFPQRFLQQRGVAWRESSAVMLCCAIPAALAVVGQSYHISDNQQAFYTLWFVLMLPFVYLLKAQLASALLVYVAVILCMFYQSWYWLCVLALLPVAYPVLLKSERANHSRLAWILALGTIFLGSAYLLVEIIPQALFGEYPYYPIVMMSGAVSMTLFGVFFEPKEPFSARPFTNVGMLLIALSLLFYTNTDAWDFYTEQYIDAQFSSFALFVVMAAILAMGVLIKRQRWELLPLTALWLVSIVLTVIYWASIYWGLASGITVIIVIANIVVFAVGIATMWAGVKYDAANQLNFGLILIMSQIMLRFFDQDFSFVVRGLVFITLGMALIGVNVWRSRAKAMAHQGTQHEQ